jgi:hypothetical protein
LDAAAFPRNEFPVHTSIAARFPALNLGLPGNFPGTRIEAIDDIGDPRAACVAILIDS